MPTAKNLLKRAYRKVEPEWVKRQRQFRRRTERTEKLWEEIEQHPERAMMERVVENSSRLFYVFQGRGMALMMEPITALRETGLMRTNLVMLRDYFGFFYHAGLNRDLPDLDSVLERLRSIRAGMPHVRETACMGTSSGGYAAILAGHYLGVDTVYAFAPQTLVSLRRAKKLAKRDDTWRFPDEHLDLARLLAEHNGHTQYKVFFCEDNRFDRRQAQRIADCPGVELCPQPGKSHLVLPSMVERGWDREVMPTCG